MKRLFQEKRYSDAKDFALGSSPTKSHQIKEGKQVSIPFPSLSGAECEPEERRC